MGMAAFGISNHGGEQGYEGKPLVRAMLVEIPRCISDAKRTISALRVHKEHGTGSRVHVRYHDPNKPVHGTDKRLKTPANLNSPFLPQHVLLSIHPVPRVYPYLSDRRIWRYPGGHYARLVQSRRTASCFTAMPRTIVGS